MIPSEEDVANFIAFAADADEGKAFVFLENASTVQEAVNQYYENPNKYSEATTPATKLADQKAPLPADSKDVDVQQQQDHVLPTYADSISTTHDAHQRPHTNVVIRAAQLRARDEQEMQNHLQTIQFKYGIYNSDLEPEHETDVYCSCPIHQYKNAKVARLHVLETWAKAVMYPGEKSYHDCYQVGIGLFSRNPYRFRVVSPYNTYPSGYFGMSKPDARLYSMAVQQTIAVNATLNAEAQDAVNAREPKHDIWQEVQPQRSNSIQILDEKTKRMSLIDSKGGEKQLDHSHAPELVGKSDNAGKSSKFASLKKALSIKSSEEKAAAKAEKWHAEGRELRDQILSEENGRWPDAQWRQIVTVYQQRVGMAGEIARLRSDHPIQYLHLLRAGYFEPIPVAWANLISNPLKFTIEAAAGWRGITPAWRGFEDTAEERLYWVLNHRAGSDGARLKPDVISALEMARARMECAVEPPPEYFSANDTCHVQHTSPGYSKQVMPAPFKSYDAPETKMDDTMILLDVSGSMDFDPVRPNYNQYLIEGYSKSTQPKNRDVAKAIVRRFVDAMINHDHQSQGYQLTTFANQANYIGTINHRNFNRMWRNVNFGGGTRVMTGWQKVKELHFQKHAESATYHPTYGWQAGPQTPMLRLLLLLDGEATDMDEFELDLLGLPWAHVTIFLIGVDGCPHHHRHANELQRISDVNHHVSFVDAQGNTPERFVTHELLKRHLGYDVSMARFEELEQPPPYTE